MDLDELLRALDSPEPGSVNHEFTKMLIQGRIAGMQLDVAGKALHWARLSSVGVLGSALIGLSALLISVL